MNKKVKLTDRKKEEILKAATKEFLKKGFQATSMDTIAKKANVSKRTIYNHFENKEVLFKEIVFSFKDKVCHLSGNPYNSDKPLKDQLYEMAKKEYNNYSSDNFSRLTRMVLSEFIRSPKLAQNVIKDIQKNQYPLVKWMEDAIKDGKIKKNDPIFLAHQLAGMIESFLFWPLIINVKLELDNKDADEIINSAINVFLNTYEIKKI